jgi:hypothetical protein
LFSALCRRAIAITPASVRLIPITDRGGNVYKPPTEHRGIQLEDISPLAIAEPAISYMRNMIGEASKLIEFAEKIQAGASHN